MGIGEGVGRECTAVKEDIIEGIPACALEEKDRGCGYHDRRYSKKKRQGVKECASGLPRQSAISLPCPEHDRWDVDERGKDGELFDEGSGPNANARGEEEPSAFVSMEREASDLVA